MATEIESASQWERGTYNYLNDAATALPMVLQESGPDGNISYAYGLEPKNQNSMRLHVCAARKDFSMYQRKFLSRDQWFERGRVVTAPNEEAKAVFNYWGSRVRGTRHVFSAFQTIPVEQSQQPCAAEQVAA